MMFFLQISTSSGSKDKADMVIASASADTNVRLIAVKELLSSLFNDNDLSSTDKVRQSSLVKNSLIYLEYQGINHVCSHSPYPRL